MKAHRATQKDIADQAGVCRATVSLALRNDPSIPETTRSRINEIAASLGYAPDPMLSGLAAYRNRLRPPIFHGTLAWIINGFPDWKRISVFSQYYEGIVERAARYGYKIEIFDIRGPELSKERIVKVLRARGIQGLLMCPQPTPGLKIELPWHLFSAVALGYSLAQPRLNVISPTQYRGAVLAMRHLYRAGYKRIGYLHFQSINEGSDNNFLAGYLVEDNLHRGGSAIPTLVDSYQPEDTPGIVAWIRKYKLDAILSSSDVVPDRLRQAGLKIPDEFGVACLLLSPNTKESGLQENYRRVGEVAVDTLTAMIQRGERDVPEVPINLLVEGKWRQGESTRPIADSPKNDQVDRS